VLSDCGRRPGDRPPRQPGTADGPSPERPGGQREPLRQGGAAGPAVGSWRQSRNRLKARSSRIRRRQPGSSWKGC